jgi:hypothetical protein
MESSLVKKQIYLALMILGAGIVSAPQYISHK